MLYKSQLISQGSGSVGGFTASHNRFGSYIRNRTKPVNPNSAAQSQIRSAMADLTAAWQSTLTPAQRQAWSDYGQNTPVTNRLGDSITLTGLNHYVRSNVPRTQSSVVLRRVDSAPTITGLPGVAFPTVTTLSAATQELSISWIGDDTWTEEEGSAMIISMGLPQSPTINYFGGPYKFYGIIAGAEAAPPEAPQTPTPSTTPYVFVAGQKVFFRLRISRADGRLSNWFGFNVTAAA